MFAHVLATEFIKLRRSKVTWATLGGLSMGPLGIALFTWIVSEPERAAELGLMGTKAQISGIEATWPSYLSMMTMIVGIGGMVLLAFIVAYVFGREYEDATAKNMLALPVPRHWFVLAKLVVVFVWWLVLGVFVLAESFAIGFALDLPGFSMAIAGESVRNTIIAASLSYLLAPTVAWVTIATRSGGAAVGFALATLALGNLFGKTGWAVWFPWSIVPLMIGMVGRPMDLPTGSYAVLALVFALGIVGSIAQVRVSDLAQ